MYYPFLKYIFKKLGLEILMLAACVMSFYYFAIIRRPTEDPLALDVVLLFICIIGLLITV